MRSIVVAVVLSLSAACGAALGVGIDALIRSDKTVYLALAVAVAARVSPGRGRHRVDVVWSW